MKEMILSNKRLTQSLHKFNTRQQFVSEICESFRYSVVAKSNSYIFDLMAILALISTFLSIHAHIVEMNNNFLPFHLIFAGAEKPAYGGN